MRVTGVALTQTPEGTELRADVDGLALWYRFPPGQPISPRGDAFLAATLLPAMLAGQPLEIEATVSPRLLAGADRIQDIFRAWSPVVRKIEVRASASEAEPSSEGVASFFSGGVDSAYTFLKHAPEITHILYIGGFEMVLGENAPLYQEILARNREFAAAFGKSLLLVETNLRSIYDVRRIAPAAYFGGYLASVALSAGFPRMYIPAAWNYAEIQPHGSHPLVDPLWSTEAVEIIHDGAEARRNEKMEAISRSPEALRVLRVCLENVAYNCGQCEKCLRTRLGLRHLGVSTPTLPPLTSLRGVASLRIPANEQLPFFQDHHALAVRAGDHEAARALHACIRRFVLLRTLKELDKLLLGGRLLRWHRDWVRFRRGKRPAPPQRFGFSEF